MPEPGNGAGRALAQDIADLETDAVAAVSESGQFNDMGMVRLPRPESSREDAGDDIHIPEPVSAVSDADAGNTAQARRVIRVDANHLD